MTDPMDQPVTKREQQATFDAFVPVLMDHINKQLKERFEELAQHLASSFEQVDMRFEQVDKRFEQVDKRFDDARIQMDKRFAEARSETDKRFDQERIETNKRFDQAAFEMDKHFDEARIQMVAVVDHMGLSLRKETRDLSERDLQKTRKDLESFDEKYKDLPRRVKRLERAVFKPAPAKRGRAR